MADVLHQIVAQGNAGELAGWVGAVLPRGLDGGENGVWSWNIDTADLTEWL